MPSVLSRLPLCLGTEERVRVSLGPSKPHQGCVLPHQFAACLRALVEPRHGGLTQVCGTDGSGCWAAITKYHRHSVGETEINLTVLEARSPRSGCQQSCFMFSCFFFTESSPLGLQTAVFSSCPRMASPLCACTPGICLCAQISSSYKDTCLVFNLTVTLKVLSLNTVTF